jgi:hypothetical protein
MGQATKPSEARFVATEARAAKAHGGKLSASVGVVPRDNVGAGLWREAVANRASMLRSVLPEY